MGAATATWRQECHFDYRLTHNLLRPVGSKLDDNSGADVASAAERKVRVTAIAIGLIVLVCVFGGALLGMLLRTILPEHHLNDATKDVVKLVTGLIATLAALVLGLLIASAKNSFDTVNDGFRASAAKIVILDRALAQYGPETKELRALLKSSFAARMEQFFPKEQSRTSTLVSTAATATMEGFQERIRALTPQNDTQRSLQGRALDLSDAVAQARWLGIEHEENAIPTPFQVVLVFWLALMFASFGLFATRNAVAFVALFLGAVSLSAAIFLIEELNDPLQGYIAISRAPMERALGLLGQ
jgi:hypothetical protein